MTAPPMSLANATDALGDFVVRFHNEMLRAKVKELPAREWAEEFRSCLDADEFERHHKETREWLAKKFGA